MREAIKIIWVPILINALTDVRFVGFFPWVWHWWLMRRPTRFHERLLVAEHLEIFRVIFIIFRLGVSWDLWFLLKINFIRLFNLWVWISIWRFVISLTNFLLCKLFCNSHILSFERSNSLLWRFSNVLKFFLPFFLFFYCPHFFFLLKFFIFLSHFLFLGILNYLCFWKRRKGN